MTRDELAARIGDESLVLIDVRTPEEFTGETGFPDDPRQGHIPGARNVPVNELIGLTRQELEEMVGAPPGAEVVVYCHSGGRSGFAAEVLAVAGYDARNYPGSWREWSRDPSLPAE